jgi:hypothetical protein
MRNTVLKSATATLMLMFASSALAAPSFSTVKKDDEKKDPQAAVAGLTKDEAKDAKKNAHVAQKKARTAEHKAATAAKDADKAATAASR